MICQPCRAGGRAMAAGHPVVAREMHWGCPEQTRQAIGLPDYVTCGSALCDCQHGLQTSLARKDRPVAPDPV